VVLRQEDGQHDHRAAQGDRSSCDWSRLRFTLDEDYSRAVREVFVRLWDEGLIYRGHRVIHWCPHCLTALQMKRPSTTKRRAICITSTIARGWFGVRHRGDDPAGDDVRRHRARIQSEGRRYKSLKGSG